MLFLISLIPILLTIAILDKYSKNKTSSEIMLTDIDVTIVGAAVMVFGGGELHLMMALFFVSWFYNKYIWLY